MKHGAGTSLWFNALHQTPSNVITPFALMLGVCVTKQKERPYSFSEFKKCIPQPLVRRRSARTVAKVSGAYFSKTGQVLPSLHEKECWVLGGRECETTFLVENFENSREQRW